MLRGRVTRSVLYGAMALVAVLAGAAALIEREQNLVQGVVVRDIESDQASPLREDALIRDVDNYGRNWTVFVEDRLGNVVIYSVYAIRGVGPLPLMNTPRTVRILGKQALPAAGADSQDR